MGWCPECSSPDILSYLDPMESLRDLGDTGDTSLDQWISTYKNKTLKTADSWGISGGGIGSTDTWTKIVLTSSPAELFWRNELSIICLKEFSSGANYSIRDMSAVSNYHEMSTRHGWHCWHETAEMTWHYMTWQSMTWLAHDLTMFAIRMVTFLGGSGCWRKLIWEIFHWFLWFWGVFFGISRCHLFLAQPI